MASQDPTSVKSRTGYVIVLGGVPILWGSKLQTEIALSTTEAEYIAASMSMRQLLPLRRLVNEVMDPFGLDRSTISDVSMVWEDNNGVLKMVDAEYPNMTLRSKHIAVKYHWFRSHLGDQIQMKRIDTNLQKADIFTKGLVRSEYEEKRKMIMGW